MVPIFFFFIRTHTLFRHTERRLRPMIRVRLLGLNPRVDRRARILRLDAGMAGCPDPGTEPALCLVMQHATLRARALRRSVDKPVSRGSGRARDRYQGIRLAASRRTPTIAGRGLLGLVFVRRFDDENRSRDFESWRPIGSRLTLVLPAGRAKVRGGGVRYGVLVQR